MRGAWLFFCSSFCVWPLRHHRRPLQDAWYRGGGVCATSTLCEVEREAPTSQKEGGTGTKWVFPAAGTFQDEDNVVIHAQEAPVR
jgi:hypothetical protein